MKYPVNINSNSSGSGRQYEGGYNISSRLCDMLDLAEKLFGPRDPSYSVSHIKTGHQIPRIMFSNENSTNIYIRILTDPAKNMSRACYQLAHETVHLLAPIRGVANNFEEGVATYFATYYMEEKMNEYDYWYPTEEEISYREVLARVKPTLDDNPYCIRELRSKKPNFLDMSRDDVYEVFKNHLNIEDVDWLLQKFVR